MEPGLKLILHKKSEASKLQNLLGFYDKIQLGQLDWFFFGETWRSCI